MPRGIPNTPKAQSVSQQAAQPDSAAPMIIIQPRSDGTRLGAYNLHRVEIIDELRRALIHLVATGAGVTIISHDIPKAAVVVPNTPAVPARNGHTTKLVPVRKRQFDHLDDVRLDLDDEE